MAEGVLEGFGVGEKVDMNLVAELTGLKLVGDVVENSVDDKPTLVEQAEKNNNKENRGNTSAYFFANTFSSSIAAELGIIWTA